MESAANVSYSFYVLFLLLVNVFLAFKLSRTPGFGREESWIVKLCVAASVTVLSDALCVGIGASAGFLGNYLFNFAFDLAAGCIACFFFYYCAMLFDSRVISDRRWSVAFAVPIALLVVFLVLSLWTGWVFKINPDGSYERGPLYMLFVFVLANGYTVGTIVISILGYLRKPTRANRTLLFDCIKYVLPLFAGTVFQFQFPLVPTSSMGMTLTMLFIFIDNQKRLLERKTFDAEAANAAKTEFLSRMPHDVRTPINGIVGMIGIAKENADDPERLNDCLSKIDAAANQLLEMVSDVLDMSKIESDGLNLTNEPFDLLDMLHDISAAQESLAASKGVNAESIGEEALAHPYLMGSPMHVRSILMNLVSNGIKYTERGGLVTGSVRELAPEEAHSIRGLRLPEGGLDPEGRGVVIEFCVSDNGIGMSRDFAKRVFEPFTQERSDGRSSYRGSGLGLAIVKKIVDSMGGVITLETELGKGSVFTVVLPFESLSAEEYEAARLANETMGAIGLSPDSVGKRFVGSLPTGAAGDGTLPSAADADSSSVNDPACADASIEGVRVLLVEDNELNLEIAQYVLEDAGADVHVARDGQKALYVFSGMPQGTFDVVLMDVMMPVMDGLEATRRIRALNRPDAASVPIIGMSANAFADDIRAAEEAGMDDYVMKPLKREKLLYAISRLAGK
ncbi:MAG: response regulator [Coriobacteriia bacterium]|nr:response regulator [Coriobacteriia bacterium]